MWGGCSALGKPVQTQRLRSKEDSCQRTINTEDAETPAASAADPEVALRSCLAERLHVLALLGLEVFVQPSLAKGMPFHNGFLYKLGWFTLHVSNLRMKDVAKSWVSVIKHSAASGDGLLNTGWNLRYFLLIGFSL